MATYVTPKINTAFICYIGLPSQADTNIFQANPTLATGDAKVSIDGGALADLATLPDVDPNSSKLVKLALSAAEMNGANIQVVMSDAAGSEWGDVIVNIQTTARQIDDLAYPATTGRSLLVSAGGAVAADLISILGTAITETAGQLAAAFTKFFNKATPTGTINSLPDAVAGAASGVAIVGSNMGTTTSALDLGTAAKAAVNVEMVDVISVDTYAEPTGVPGATVSLAEKIGRYYQALRNGFTITGSAKTFQDNSNSAQWKKPLSDDGTTYTESKGTTP